MFPPQRRRVHLLKSHQDVSGASISDSMWRSSFLRTLTEHRYIDGACKLPAFGDERRTNAQVTPICRPVLTSQFRMGLPLLLVIASEMTAACVSRSQ